MKSNFIILCLILFLNSLNAQSLPKSNVYDTLYFKFNHQKNQEIKYQKTIQNKTVGEYYFNYLGEDKQPYIIFTFNYNMPFKIEKKSILRKRKIKFLDYNFLKSKPMTELNEFFNNKIIFLIDNRDSKGCQVKLKQVIYQTSMLLEM